MRVEQTPDSEAAGAEEWSRHASTPSSRTQFAFGSSNISTPAFTFERGPGSVPWAKDTASSTPSFVHSHSLTDSGQGVGQDPNERDPDDPICSVEVENDRPASRVGASSTAGSILSGSIHESLPRQYTERASLSRQLEGLRVSSLTPSSTDTAPEAPSPRVMMSSIPSTRFGPCPGTPLRSRVQDYQETSSAASTPSITVTPTPPIMNPGQQSRSESLAFGVATLCINSREGEPSQHPDSGTRLHTTDSNPSEHISHSPSPSRRRRSSPGVPRSAHRVEGEPLPTQFHQQAVQQSLQDAKAVMARIALAISSANLHLNPDSTIHNLHQQAVTLSAFQPPTSRVIGLVGDAGVGKSTLINSLLDMAELAGTSGNGSACTCVATEYHYHDRDTFLIHTDYFTADELRRQFEELLQAYRGHKALRSDATAEEREDLGRRAEIADATFRTSFGQRLNQNPTVLLDLSFARAIDTMMGWVSDILPRSERDGGLHSQESFDSMQQCSTRLKSLTSEIDRTNQGCPWPFIRKLRVYSRAYILSKGLIIVDLPGLRDLNAARQNVTERYIRQCHQVFAVADILRAVTSQGVKEVFDLARRAALSNVGVVCTMVDRIKSNEARADWPEEKDRIDDLTATINHEKERLAELKDEIKCLQEEVNLSEEDARELVQLHRDRWKTARDKSRHEFELKRHIIQVRNKKVTQAIKNTYQTYLADSELKTFCISNPLYWDNRELSADDALPFLELSGIVALRKYCMGIVAESHLRAVEEYTRNEIPAFLGSIELWVQAGAENTTTERKQQIVNLVDSLHRQLAELTSPVSQVHGVSRGLTTKFGNQIYRLMTQNSEQWSLAAGQACMTWQVWYHSTYSAFCRNYGNHETNAVGRHCWNEEAIAEMKSDVHAGWGNLQEETQSFLVEIQRCVQKGFENMIDEITLSANMDGPTYMALITLTGTLLHRQRLLDYAIEKALEDFINVTLPTLNTDALSGLRTSIVGQLLEDYYHQAQMEFGRGSDLRRKEHIKQGFSSRSLFTYHRQRTRDQFIEIADELERNINNAIVQQVTLIELDIDILKDENRLSDSERDPAFGMRVAEALEGARQQMEVACRGLRQAMHVAREDEYMTD